MRTATLHKLIELSLEDAYQQGQPIPNGYRLIHSKAQVDITSVSYAKLEVIIRPDKSRASRHRVREHAIAGFCRGVAAGLSAGENW